MATAARSVSAALAAATATLAEERGTKLPDDMTALTNDDLTRLWAERHPEQAARIAEANAAMTLDPDSFAPDIDLSPWVREPERT